MHTSYPKPRTVSRPMALLLSVLLGVPFFAGCSSSRQSSAPIDDTRSGSQTYTAPATQPQARKKGLSNGQKVAITLVGAAALYYLYKQHQNKQAEGAQGKYYLSKNGRVYYRDAQHRAHWVTPPPGGIQVPADQAQQYRDFQGYNNSTSGRTLSDVARTQPQSQLDPVPAQ